MTTLNDRKESRSYLETTNYNIPSRPILMKENSSRQKSNENIVFLNTSNIDHYSNVKNCYYALINTCSTDLIAKSSFLAHNLNNKEKSIKPEIHDKYYSKSQVFTKSKSPILQIINGNIFISQEVSIEELQNLTVQVNSKISNSRIISSADSLNLGYSKEENSNVNITLEGQEVIENSSKYSVVSNHLIGSFKSKKLIKLQYLNPNNGKLKLKTFTLKHKYNKDTSHPSTSENTNLVFALKAFAVQESKGNQLKKEHITDYRKFSYEFKKKNDLMVESLVVENADAELMQIEVVESGCGSALTVSNLTSSRSTATKGKKNILLTERSSFY